MGLSKDLSHVAGDLASAVACYDPANPCSLDELLIQADRKMYERERT